MTCWVLVCSGGGCSEVFGGCSSFRGGEGRGCGCGGGGGCGDCTIVPLVSSFSLLFVTVGNVAEANLTRFAYY